MHWGYFLWWQVLFLPLFLTHTGCQRPLWDVRPDALSSVFLFSGPFVSVLPSVTSRMVPSILLGGQLWRLSLWCDFHYIVWFRVVSSLSWDILFKFFFHLRLFCGVRFQYLQVLVNFNFIVHSDFFGIVLFSPSCVVSRFSLLARHILPWQIPSLCPDYILSLSILVFQILFHFFANNLMSSLYSRRLLSFCYSVSLYPFVHFLSMWLSGIIAITNSNNDSTSPRKIPLDFHFS